MSNSSSCGQPYATPGGPPNSCAFSPGNYSTTAQTGIDSCCGGAPYEYSPINDPPGCFQVCNIKNASTADELQQNLDTLTNCLNAAGAANVFCSTTPPKKSSGDRVPRASASWSTVVVVGALIGTSLFAL